MDLQYVTGDTAEPVDQAPLAAHGIPVAVYALPGAV